MRAWTCRNTWYRSCGRASYSPARSGSNANIEETGPSRGVTNYWEDHGLDATDDVVYRERAIYGYLGVTDARVIIVKSPVFGKLKPKHVVVEAPLESCRLDWWDEDSAVGPWRTMHFGFPREPFASVFVQIGPILLSKERRAAALRAADEVVAALGPRAAGIEPDPRWMR